eukprot:TRINITY_DN132_c0_g1_i1.p1 TRINITY_DN132_c0_g1~~TRINITY_DN132_c0_g1_i1.p1  ORF type:complete len:305 (+),score=47.98 TRINITY_DN132_c0_g1_i1:113-1027(+)
MGSQAAEAVVHSLSGSLAGIVALSVTYPLNTISTRMQVQNKNSAQKYHSLPDALQKIISTEGVSGLFSGLTSGWVGTALTQGVYYYWYEFFRALRGSGKRTLSTSENLLVASAAGVLTAVITNPIWVVNTRMTVKNSAAADSKEKHASGNLFTTFFKILKEEGFLTLYAGLTPALILVSNPTIQYAVFEKLKALLSSFLSRGQGKTSPITAFQVFVLGALAKVVATVLTYPYIMVKARLQVAKKATSTLETLQSIYHEDGVAGYYKGLNTKIVGSVLNAALLMMCKDQIVVLLFALFRLLQKKN